LTAVHSGADQSEIDARMPTTNRADIRHEVTVIP
jgi:hypothetical protein